MQDRIEKVITLRAPVEVVWRAITDHREFGTWFKAALDGPFTIGGVTTGRIMEPGYEGMAFWLVTVLLDPPHLFAFDWPSEEGASPEVIGSPGATTRVTFLLEAQGTGTRLTLTESGFDHLPADLAAVKFRDNDGGWSIQAERIRAHVDG